MKLPELSGFKLISGSGGLDKYVDATEIIDFEFADGIEFTREEMFYGHSVGITSLMFARQKPELILDARYFIFTFLLQVGLPWWLRW